MPFVFKVRRKTIFILPAMSHHILSNHHTWILFSVTQSAFFYFSVLKTSTATHLIIIYFQVVLRLSFRRFEFLWQRSSGVKNAHWSLAASIISVSTSTTLKSISGCLWLIVNFKWYYDCPFVVSNSFDKEVVEWGTLIGVWLSLSAVFHQAQRSKA